MTNGEWVPLSLDHPPYIPHIPRLYCGSLDEYYQRKPWNTWEWRPYEDCMFTKWDAQAFCDMFQNETILIMGDSLTEEHAYSLGELLNLWKGGENGGGYYDYRNACSGSTEIMVQRDDTLNPEKVANALKENPRIAVFNRGAHYTDDDELMNGIQQIITLAHEWQERCREENRQCLLIWRTSVPGHSDCRAYTTPINNLELMEQRLQMGLEMGRFSKQWGWTKFNHQNELIINALNESGLIFDVLDAYAINMLRPDSHTDCLHSCLGSKQDVYSQAILHLMRLRQQNMARFRVRLHEGKKGTIT